MFSMAPKVQKMSDFSQKNITIHVEKTVEEKSFDMRSTAKWSP